MGKALLALLLICFFISEPICHAQTIQVSDPRIELKDNIIHITYDILNSDLSDKFIVRIHVTDANGNRINANSLTGDIGDKVSGGNNKHITWDLKADKIFRNAKIYVKIHAKTIPAPEPEITLQMADPEEEDPSGEIIKKETPTTAESKSFNRTGIIIQSLAIPGLGLSRMTGNPHWLRGVAGYGCIAGSVILNRQAISTYDDIDDLEDYDDKNELFQKSQSRDNISEVLACAAIGIWVTDFIWTLVGTSDLKKKPLYSDASGFSLKTTIDPLTYTPLVGFRYRF